MVTLPASTLLPAHARDAACRAALKYAGLMDGEIDAMVSDAQTDGEGSYEVGESTISYGYIPADNVVRFTIDNIPAGDICA